MLVLENEDDRVTSEEYYMSIVEIKDCKVMIDGNSFFDIPVQKKKKQMKRLR